MRIRRGQLHDFYVEEDRGIAMVGSEVVALSEIATAIVQAVPEVGGTSLETVTAAVVDQYGEPDPPLKAVTLIKEQVHDLAAHLIIEIYGEDNETGPSDGVNRERTADPNQAVREAMRAVLATDEVAPWVPPASLDEDAFLAAVERQRIAAQLATGIHRVDLPPGLRARLRKHADNQRAAARPLIHDLHDVMEGLTRNEVRALTFKGLALAAQAWGDPLARGYGDIDVLIHPLDVSRTLDHLQRAGWSITGTYPRPDQGWAWRHFLRVDLEMTLTRGSTALDLHWHAQPARSTFPGFDELWQRRATVEVDGEQVATFSAYDALAHSAGHSARDHWRWLRGVADVHRLMSDQATWRDANRRLGPDQLLTVGLAGRWFGVPNGAPRIVHEAVATSSTAEDVAIDRQVRPEHVAESDRLPGVSLRDSLAATRRGRPSAADHVRAALRSLTPARMLARETGRHASLGIARVLWRRACGAAPRLIRSR